MVKYLADCLKFLGLVNVYLCKKGLLPETKPNFVVFVSPDDMLAIKVNDFCLKEKIPWLICSFKDNEVIIGPLMIPYITACYNCYQLRLLSNKTQKPALSSKKVPYKNTAKILAFLTLDYLLQLTKFDFAGKIFVLDLGENTWYTNNVLVMPCCPLCLGVSRQDTFGLEDEEKLDDVDYRKLIGKKTGVIQQSFKAQTYPDEPALKLHTCRLADFSAVFPEKTFRLSGGCGLTEEEALSAAIGESAERYGASFYSPEEVFLSSYRNLPWRAVEPERFALFTREQTGESAFPYSEFSRNTVIRWTLAYSLTEKRLKAVPSAMVFFPYTRADFETAVSPCQTTGLSCGKSFQEAILGGIYECLERDAFALMWMTRQNCPHVDIDYLDKDIKLLRSYLAGLEYSVLDITSDIRIPVFWTAIKGSSRFGMLISNGACCHLDPHKAVKKSLLEAFQNRHFLLGLKKKEPDWQREGFSCLETFDDHARFYSYYPDLFEKCDFLKMKATVKLKENPYSGKDTFSQLSYCLTLLKEKGFEVLVKDLTTSDLACAGLKVVRVIIPSLQPLHFNHNQPFLGGKRMSSLLKGNTLNLYPHPFA